VRPTALVLRALGLGDLLTGVPALRAIARALPDHHRVLAAPAALAELVALVDVPGTSGAVIHEVADHRGLASLPERLHGPDVAVNLHGKGPQSHAALRATRPGRLVGFADPATHPDGPPWRAGEHEVARWCRMLAAHGIACDRAELRIAAPPAPPDARVRGATVVHPGAASGARRWPAERWAAVARAEAAAGRTVLLTGGADERELAQRVAAAAGLADDAVLAGRTSLRELAAVVAAAARVVSGDTGVAHLATALGTPSVVLFGPTAPTEWGPPADDGQHVVLWAGRTGDPHAAEPDPGLLALGVDEVNATLARLP
jgi:ADP-heptose:LPS heptosyltransferase